MKKKMTFYDWWQKNDRGCGSCGWTPAAYEIEEDLKEDLKDETDKEFWFICHSDYNEEGDHRGFYIGRDEVKDLIFEDN